MQLKEVIATAGVQAEPLSSVDIDAKRTVHVVKIAPRAGLEIAKKLLAVSDKTGYVPLFLQDSDLEDFSWLLDNHQHDGDSMVVEATLEAADQVDLEEWLAEIRENEEEFPLGDFTKKAQSPRSLPVTDTLVLVPVKKSWQIFAVIHFGGWNECPDAEIQIALHKKWHEQYGSDVLAIGESTVHCIVAKPPANRDQAVALANEQAYYCLDAVGQGDGDGTISGLAVDLLNAPIWEFWWD